MLIKGNDDKKIGKKACGISGLPLLGAVTEWQLLILQQLTLPLTIGCRQVFKKRELIIYKQRNSKKYFSNYRTCMGMPLQRMYGLHILISNFSATHDLIQKTKMTVLISEIKEFFSRNILIKGLISEQPYTNYQII